MAEQHEQPAKPVPTIIWHPSPNFGDRPAGAAIDTLVLHYTGMPNGDMALTRMCDPASQVSAHYMVEEDGCIYQLVAESKRAWHAGRGFWRGCTDINSSSIGIEIVNPGHEFGYRPFAIAQIDAVIALCQALLGRHDIPAHNIIAHSDMAPDRKEDPGELFPWQKLAENGIGLWPQTDMRDQSPPDESKQNFVSPADRGNETSIMDGVIAATIVTDNQSRPVNAPQDTAPPDQPEADAAGTVSPGDCEMLFDRLLAQFGYGPGQAIDNRIAFQRHWRPHCLNGRADEQSLAILTDLIGQCPPLP